MLREISNKNVYNTKKSSDTFLLLHFFVYSKVKTYKYVLRYEKKRNITVYTYDKVDVNIVIEIFESFSAEVNKLLTRLRHEK